MHDLFCTISQISVKRLYPNDLIYTVDLLLNLLTRSQHLYGVFNKNNIPSPQGMPRRTSTKGLAATFLIILPGKVIADGCHPLDTTDLDRICLFSPIKYIFKEYLQLPLLKGITLTLLFEIRQTDKIIVCFC